MFETRRLHIIPARLEALIAEFHGREALGRVLGVDVPESWPAELLDEHSVHLAFERLKTHPTEAEWWFHYFVELKHATLIGAGGYKGPPDGEGRVEILYSILPEYRRKGYASEAVHALVEHAFDVALVKKVVATTWPDHRASVGVLEQCGFIPENPDEDGPVHYVLARGRRPILPPAC